MDREIAIARAAVKAEGDRELEAAKVEAEARGRAAVKAEADRELEVAKVEAEARGRAAVKAEADREVREAREREAEKDKQLAYLTAMLKAAEKRTSAGPHAVRDIS